MKANNLFTRLLLAALTGATLAGCVSGKVGEGGATTPETPAQAGAASPDLLAYYAEERVEGKIYVLGDIDTHVAYFRSHDVPNSVMKVGAGPGGEAVILQADPKDTSLTDRLWKEFQKRNLYYAEETQDGQLFVVGSLISNYNLLRDRKLENSETAEINGVKVAFETNPADPLLLKRLKTQYAEKHPAP